jgi:hypothetical protein
MSSATDGDASPAIGRSVVVQACRALLRPIASLLLKCGLTWREFAEISKGVFIEVAGAEHGLKGRPTNVSRVSILTGISRKEIVRVRELLAEESTPPTNKTTDATRLLSGWHQDPQFVDEWGAPKLLPVDGEGATFGALWERYGGDVPLTSMRKELERVGAISVQPDGRLKAERRYFMPVPFDPQWILNAGSTLRDLGNSISHNLSGSTTVASGTQRRFIGRATNDSIDERAAPAFAAWVEEQGQAFLESADAWLTEHQATPQTPGVRKRIRLGLGVFTISGE